MTTQVPSVVSFAFTMRPVRGHLLIFDCDTSRLMRTAANIWSHLLGMLWFFVGLFYFYRHVLYYRPYVPASDAVAIALFYVCVVICFLLSTCFHTFSDHSPELHRFGNELDHLGIVLVMWGTGIANTYFGFYCSHSIRNAYFLALTTTALGCAVFTLRPKFRKPSYRTARFLMYVFLGSSLFAPCVHGLYLYDWELLNDRMSLDHFLGLAIINFSGAAIYAARVPERWFPKRFDLIGQSHNLMHVLVFAGAVARLRGLLLTLDYWERQAVAGQTCMNSR